MTYKVPVCFHSLFSWQKLGHGLLLKYLLLLCELEIVEHRRKLNLPLLGPHLSGWNPTLRAAEFLQLSVSLVGEAASLIQSNSQKAQGQNSKTNIIKIWIAGSPNFPSKIRISPTAPSMVDQSGSSQPESSWKSQAVYYFLYEVSAPSIINLMLSQIYLCVTSSKWFLSCILEQTRINITLFHMTTIWILYHQFSGLLHSLSISSLFQS